MKKYIIIILSVTCLIISLKSAFANGANYSYSSPKSYSDSALSDCKEKILFIVDFSNSMNEFLVDGRKIDVALKTMASILPRLSSNVYTGLRVYGHKNGFTPNQSCTASELVSPISQNNTNNISSRLSKLNAAGWTPITYSLKKAVNSDFIGFNGAKRIILLSDGGENCDESPCDYAIKLMKYRDDIKIDVIAFTISDQDANDQLKCAALVTSGKFYTANTAAELARSLEDSLNMEKAVQGVIIKH